MSIRFFGAAPFIASAAFVALGMLLAIVRTFVGLRAALAAGNRVDASVYILLGVGLAVCAWAAIVMFVAGTTRVVLDGSGVTLSWFMNERRVATVQRLKWSQVMRIDAVGTPVSLWLSKRLGGTYVAIGLDKAEASSVLEVAAALRAGSA